jgi:hypothetical protein
MHQQTSGRLVLLSRVDAVLGSLHDADGVTVFDALCEGCVRAFAISGAGLTFILDGRPQGTLGVSDERSRMVEELQFTYGEGPCVDADRTRRTVSEPRLVQAASRWPAFGPEALQAGVEAVFAIPLQLGNASYGALDLYRDTPGRLAAGELADARAIADGAIVMMLALQGSSVPGALTPALEHMTDHRSMVHQAAGMITVQLDMSIEEALVALRARAFRTGTSIAELAADVVARRVRLDEQ